MLTAAAPARFLALRRVLTGAAFAVLPIALLAGLVVWGLGDGVLAKDFADAFRPAAQRLVDGHPLYPTPDDPSLAARTAYAYPPLLALLLVPVSWLPATLAAVLATLACVAMLLAIPAVLDVRDWRCYGVLVLWAPSFAAVQTANVTILLGLLGAIAWRQRERPIVAGLALALSLALKPLLWPVAVLLIALRLFRTAAWALTAAACLWLVSWAAIGFEGVGRYGDIVRRLTDLQAYDAYTPYAIALDAGASSGIARALGIACAVALVAAAFAVGLRGRPESALSLAVAAAIVASPLVWIHYFVLLAVPVAASSRRLSAAWLAPLGMWVGSGTGNGSTPTTIAVALIAGATLLCTRWPARSRRSRTDAPAGTRAGASPLPSSRAT